MPRRGTHYHLKPGYKQYGSWGWDDHRLWSKIEKTDNDNDCWLWTGAMSPTGALMGAWRNGKQQMTQARRLVWMSVSEEDVTPYSVTLTCNSQMCCNPNHFELKPTNRPDAAI